MNTAIWDYKDPNEWMARIARGNMPPLMIQCALTGGVQGKEVNPNLPETMEEQVEAAVEAYKAGACTIHIHVRNPENVTEQTNKAEDYSKVNEMIRERCPGAIISNTTGGLEERPVIEKLAPIFADCKPDIISLNPGPFMARFVLKERKEPLMHPREERTIYTNLPMTYSDLRYTASLCLEHDIKPETEVFHTGNFWVVNDLIEKELLKPPYLMQFVFGFQTATYPTPWNMLSMLDEIPENSIYFCPAIGPHQLPINMMAMIMGGHVRVGLEDNLYYHKGELSKSGAQQVERIVRIAKELNRPVATVDQAREMLGLPPAG